MAPLQQIPAASNDVDGFIAKAASWLLTALLALVGIVYGTLTRRISKLEDALDGKASNEEMNRQRDNVATLFNENKELRRDLAEFREQVANQHTAQVHLINTGHLNIIDRINSAAKQTPVFDRRGAPRE